MLEGPGFGGALGVLVLSLLFFAGLVTDVGGWKRTDVAAVVILPSTLLTGACAASPDDCAR